MTAEINEFSVLGEMLRAMGRTGHHQVDCSRVVGPTMANERSLTVTHRDGRTSRRLEVDECRWHQCLVGDVLYNMVRMCCSANARSCLTIKCLTKLQSKWGNVKKVFVTLDCNLVKVTTLDNCYCVWHSTKRNYQNGSRKLDSIIILTSQYIILQNVVKYNGWKLSPYGIDGRLFASDVCANYKVTWHKN